jgi:hypothetical protein
VLATSQFCMLSVKTHMRLLACLKTRTIYMYRFTLSLLACLAVGFGAMAQAPAQITMRAARALPIGTVVTVGGIVTNGSELGAVIRYFQDGTAGIPAYFSAAQVGTITTGDSILVTGTLKDFRNLLELDPVASVQVVSSNNTLHPPVVVNQNSITSVFNDTYEGMLVQIDSIQSFTTVAGATPTSFLGNTNYNLNGSSATQARISSTSVGTTGLVGKPVPSGAGWSLVGLMSQFCNTPGCLIGYQLLPRLASDLLLGPAPNILARPLQTSVSRTSMTLTFNTENEGGTRVEYGPSPILGNLINDPAQTRNHVINLTNLLPGTVYYFRISSSNSNGNSELPGLYTFVTESNSTGRIITYFNRTTEPDAATPGNNAITLNQAIDDTLIAYINRAQQTLDIAIYNLNNSGLSDMSAAINAAAARGVVCRLIYDGTSANLGVNGLSASVARLRSPTGTNPNGGFYSIMHNKFVIIDADIADANIPILWTGSTNLTNAQINSDWNNVIIFQDQSMARVFKVEFEEMWGSTTTTPGAIYNASTQTGTARFGNNKQDNTPHEVKVGNNRVEVYFSPSDGTSRKIIDAINSANSSFQFSQYVFTRTEIAFALADKFRSLGAGNCSRGLIDDTSGTGGGNVWGILSPMGAARRLFPLAGILHHKYLIVDQDNVASDPLVVTGSHNWSTAGETTNDENTVMVHNALVANQFYQEFAKRFGADAGGVLCPFTSVASSIKAKALVMAPNPTTGLVWLQLQEAAQVEIISTTGTVVYSQKVAASEGLNLAGLAAGVYQVRAVTSTGLFTGRVALQ